MLLFISDLHLSPQAPGVTRIFLDFLGDRARNAEHLYILGDLFEVWVGDDGIDDPDDGFNRQLTAAFDGRLGLCKVEGARSAIPLTARYARDFARERLVLVGDAAHTIHPLAGQGVNLGFKDVACWAGLLGKAGAQWHELALAGRYEGRRRPDNLLMQSGMDLFYGVFSNEIGPLRLARNLALNLADKAGPLKEMALRYALGLV